MAKKKVVYQITRTKFQLIEVETEEQELLIKELNRDFERVDKQEKTARKRCVSLDSLFENEGYEIADSSPSGEEAYIEKTEREQFNARLYKAINSLTKRQKEIVVKVFFQGKSQTEVARELSITKGTVSVTMERALANLKEILEKK